MKLAYLGPYGTFGSEAALSYNPEAELVAVPSNEEVLRAVERGDANEGIVPIENSLEGPVNQVVDELIHNSKGIWIAAELHLPIEHCLIAPERMISHTEAHVVYSHPQALGQCAQWLSRFMPVVPRLAALSTVQAVEKAMGHLIPAVAIAPARAAELYSSTKVLVRGIQDDSSNTTRFIVVSKEPSSATGDDKTSFCFTPIGADRPGALFWPLGEFARLGINLTKIESRPTKKGLGTYVFLVDLQGHQDDPQVCEALEGVRRQVSQLKIFGSYPRWQNGS